jgi:hypothetical protein
MTLWSSNLMLRSPMEARYDGCHIRANRANYPLGATERISSAAASSHALAAFSPPWLVTTTTAKPRSGASHATA